jgi:hypothetical protein
MRKGILTLSIGLLGLSAFVPRAKAQAAATTTGPGVFFSIGGTASAYQADYGKRVLGGVAAFGDLHFRSRYSIEGEARFLRFNTNENVREQTYLVGPRVDVLHHDGLRPYVKFLVGAGRIDFPFNYATGGYFVMAPGAGLNYRVNSFLTLRVIDAEYQVWPQFTFGALHPYGISAGVSVRITRPNLFRRDPYIY